MRYFIVDHRLFSFPLPFDRFIGRHLDTRRASCLVDRVPFKVISLEKIILACTLISCKRKKKLFLLEETFFISTLVTYSIFSH